MSPNIAAVAAEVSEAAIVLAVDVITVMNGHDYSHGFGYDAEKLWLVVYPNGALTDLINITPS